MAIILGRMASKRMAERQEELKAKSKISFFRKAKQHGGFDQHLGSWPLSRCGTSLALKILNQLKYRPSGKSLSQQRPASIVNI